MDFDETWYQFVFFLNALHLIIAPQQEAG